MDEYNNQSQQQQVDPAYNAQQTDEVDEEHDRKRQALRLEESPDMSRKTAPSKFLPPINKGKNFKQNKVVPNFVQS